MPKTKRKPKNSFTQSLMQQPWMLICVLVTLGLLWPFLKTLGFTDGLSPQIVGAIWLAIRAVWILAVVFRWVGDPIWTLVITSGLYGVMTVIPQQIAWDQEPAARVAGALATIITSLIFGFLLGIIAKFFQALRTNR